MDRVLQFLFWTLITFLDNCEMINGNDMTGDRFKLYIHGHDINAPDSIDWTNYNGQSYVTLVKNQRQCGSYWVIWVCNAFNISIFAIRNIAHIYRHFQ